MTTFDEREKGFERKFIHDQELAFKTHARHSKLIGLWAAEKLGKKNEAAQQYAKDLAVIDFHGNGDDHILEHLLRDFARAGLTISAHDILVEMDRLLPLAQEQILGAS